MTTSNNYPQIFAAITNEETKRANELKADILATNDIATILTNWRYKDLFTSAKLKSKWELIDLHTYLCSRIDKKLVSKLDAQLQHLINVSNAKDLDSCVISMSWAKSRMWGSNPSAEAKVCNVDSMCEYFESGSIGGCGYDKGSTAIANCLNQSLSVLKALYNLRETNLTDNLQTVFSYGAGYGILPRIEGGVGVSCYDRIFEKVGFSFKTTASGKMFDVYTISKIANNG